MLNPPDRCTSLRPSWAFSFATGAVTVIAAVFGMYLANCGGVVEAFGFTVLLFGLFMPAVPQVLTGITAIVIGVALCVRWDPIKVLHERLSMPAYAWVALGLVVGMIYGWNAPLNACMLKT